MRLDEVQDAIHGWISRFRDGYWPPLANLARLAEEVGELARELNDRFGPKAKKAGEPPGDLAGELGDILFVVGALANQLGISLEDAFRGVLAKYAARDAWRWAPAEPRQEDVVDTPPSGRVESERCPGRSSGETLAPGEPGVQVRERVALLYDFYGPLLTGRQQDLVRAYYLEDLSLGEIAGTQRVSRQAVHEQLRRALEALERYEERLGLVAEFVRRQAALEALAGHLSRLRRQVAPGDPAAASVEAAWRCLQELMRADRGEEG